MPPFSVFFPVSKTYSHQFDVTRCETTHPLVILIAQLLFGDNNNYISEAFLISLDAFIMFISRLITLVFLGINKVMRF